MSHPPTPIFLTPMPMPGSLNTPYFKGKCITDFLDSFEAHRRATNIPNNDLLGSMITSNLNDILAVHWDEVIYYIGSMSDHSLKCSNPHIESFFDEHPTTRLKPNMSLETTVNILDDATHARLDTEVIALFKDERLTPGICEAGGVYRRNLRYQLSS